MQPTSCGRTAATLLAAIILLACGGDDGDDAEPAATTGVTAGGTEATDDTGTTTDATTAGTDETDDTSAAADTTAETETTQAEEPSGDDACAVATQADAEVILGEPVALDESTSAAPGVLSECVWINLAEDHSAILQFRVFDGAFYFTEEVYAEEEDYERIDGLGDEAFAIVGDTGVTLYVLNGDRVLQLDASEGGGGFDSTVARDQLIELAGRAIG